MLLATPEQRTVRLVFPRAGPFRPFGRQKDMKERLEVNPSEQSRLRTALEYKYRRRNAHSKFLLNRYLYILRSLVVALYCDDSTVILNITSVWLVILSEVKDLKKRFFVTLRMTHTVQIFYFISSNCFLGALHTGQTQSAGKSSKAVLAGMPPFISPNSGS